MQLMRVTKVAYSTTDKFSPIAVDYVENIDALRNYITDKPSVAACLTAAKNRVFSDKIRRDLVQVLNEQYDGVDIHPALRENLDKLGVRNTFTVTTGHQCVLLTGPLFFPFKVLNAIRLAKEFQDSDSNNQYVPVLWLATEDHDREEIEHVYVHGQKIEWTGDQTGPVGRMHLKGIESFIELVEAELGMSHAAAELKALINECYKPDYTLAYATRLFVNALFGEFGVVGP